MISFSFKFSCFLFAISTNIAYKWTGWFADIESTVNFSFTIARRVWQVLLLFATGVAIGKGIDYLISYGSGNVESDNLGL